MRWQRAEVFELTNYGSRGVLQYGWPVRNSGRGRESFHLRQLKKVFSAATARLPQQEDYSC
jgi:hypothetical protein